jgi:hypothetical protein
MDKFAKWHDSCMGLLRGILFEHFEGAGPGFCHLGPLCKVEIHFETGGGGGGGEGKLVANWHFLAMPVYPPPMPSSPVVGGKGLSHSVVSLISHSILT